MRLLRFAVPAMLLVAMHGCTCAETVGQKRFACQTTADCASGNTCRGGECRGDSIPAGACFQGETQKCDPATCARPCGPDGGWQGCAPVTGAGFDTNPLHCGACGRECSQRLGDALTCVDARCTCTLDSDCPTGDVCGVGGVCVPDIDLCARVACDGGSVCRGGACAVVPCDPGCSPGEVCEQATVTCRPIDACHFAGPCGDGGICEGAPRPDGEACNDGNACSFGDVCSAGACSGTGYSCPAANQCQQSVACAGDGGCEVVNVQDGTRCDDGTLCTHLDQCVAGQCSGTAYTCTQTQCAASASCDGDGGCINVPRNVGAACNDTLGCTFGDSCDDAGFCAGTAYSCPGVTECKQAGVCLGDGGCDVVNKTDGTACNDGVACTGGDLCTNGTCAGSALLSYQDGDSDGKGNSNITLQQCPVPAGYVLDGGDCNDGSAFVKDLMSAVADVDQDGFTASTTLTPNTCVGVSATVGGRTYYRSTAGTYTWSGTASATADCNDADGEVYNSRASMVIDADHDGYYTGAAATACVGASMVFNGRTYYADTAGAYVYLDLVSATAGSDCLDSDADVFITRSVATDADHDGFTTTTTLSSQCTGAASVINTRTYYATTTGAFNWWTSVSASADCNDANAAITGSTTYYTDGDGDTYGAGAGVAKCTPLANDVLNNTDCNDADADVYATRSVAEDKDHDAFTTTTSTSPTCTGDPSVFNARTYYDNELGVALWLAAASSALDCDDTNAGVTGPATWYRDADVDGYGNSSVSLPDCSQPAGYVSNNTDCNDASALEYRLISSALDTDQDGYSTTAVALNCVGASTTANGRTYYYEFSAAAYAYVLGSQVLAVGDCAPTNGALAAGVNNVLNDDDRDGYPYPNDSSFSVACAGPPFPYNGRTYFADGSGGWYLDRVDCIGRSGNSCPNIDCYDLNASANPAQTGYFTTARGDGSFDYNCSGTITGNASGTYCASVTSGVTTYTDGTCVATSSTATICNTPTAYSLPGACGRRTSAGTSVYIVSGSCVSATVASATTIGCR